MSTVEYRCPVDGCEWAHSVNTTPFAELNLPAGWAIEPVEVVLSRVERALEAHTATHTPAEYLKTIQRLNAELTVVSRVESRALDDFMNQVLRPWDAERWRRRFLDGHWGEEVPVDDGR